ncbi:MAG: winged helix-turn-helix domain-containing protein [Chloroflexi bacterium]|nr:winged helix-turn-helix domain-containing protein [Chloroflexota bacterium]MCI0581154.1 winged helix-turn-helix domain-containing protein [Chloroflexota bacterium]MCI0645376.1 winged helix-turn-helix domain-containing protein [Chloroflexota bacterium]MCI0727193.1 winged helix-turn-helix domain-containing protein [Chloroflexota bacterium]
MKHVSILLADDDFDFLTICAEFLESAGYQILKANSPVEAAAILESAHFHLAILDLRLAGGDDRDKSGLLLAKNTARSIPKLILTAFPAYQDVAEVMKLDDFSLPPAVDFLEKGATDLHKLLAIIEQTLEKYVAINWNLIIRWGEALSMPLLAALLEPHLDRQGLAGRLDELEDLFGKLFFESHQVTIDSLLAQGPGLVFLKVYAFDGDGLVEPHIVCCGLNKPVREETRRYQTVAPHQGNATKLGLGRTAETNHFAATAYRFLGRSLEETGIFKEFFHYHPAEESAVVIRSLFRDNLALWHGKGRYHNGSETAQAFYLRWLEEHRNHLSIAALQERVEGLCSRLFSTGLGQCVYTPYTLLWRLPGIEPISYPNPINYLDGKSFVSERLVQWGMTHGRVCPETIVVDANAPAWLIDFSQAGPAPLLHDFASLETAIKLNLLDKLDLAGRHTLEEALLRLTNLDSEVSIGDVKLEVAQALKIVAEIRQLAFEMAGCDWRSYLTGLFFLAVEQLIFYESDRYYTGHELLPFAHALLAASMAGRTLVSSLTETTTLPSQAHQSLWIDKDHRVVWVEGKPIHDLTAQEFQILCFLYENAGQLCERRAIVEQGLGEKFDEYDVEQSRLTTALHRLRQKIEPDPQNLKYLVNVRGRGYKLLL